MIKHRTRRPYRSSSQRRHDRDARILGAIFSGFSLIVLALVALCSGDIASHSNPSGLAGTLGFLAIIAAGGLVYGASLVISGREG